MHSYIEEINLEFDLRKARVLCYRQTESSGNIILAISTDGDSVVEFVFFDVMLFIHCGDDISKFCINRSTGGLFDAALHIAYGSDYERLAVPPREKMYHFMSPNDEPCIEVACMDYKYCIVK
jgi:hypothetical protein